ncbi:MAG TPA: hypothetical protein PKD05_03725 [Candidatus Melainabacteria bacterium]|nr:hypothetical protein [Candidatus Melainabacteria bacterium]
MNKVTSLALISCLAAATTGIAFPGAETWLYEKENGPPLFSKESLNMLKEAEAHSKDGLNFGILKIHAAARKLNKHRPVAIITSDRAQTTVAINDDQTYFISSLESITEPIPVRHRVITTASPIRLNRQLDEIYFPNQASRKVEKEAILKALQELSCKEPGGRYSIERSNRTHAYDSPMPWGTYCEKRPKYWLKPTE